MAGDVADDDDVQAGERIGLLQVVATPIGNLGDLTRRAVEAFRGADVILAEDTRRARGLLSHLGITGKRVERLDAQVESGSLVRWLQRLEDGDQLVLVSDAGTPAVSDPGARLVSAATAEELNVTSLPGASAVTTAIAASGFGGSRFSFLGFAPRKGPARRQWLDDMAARSETVVAFEAPTRLQATLQQLAELQPTRQVMVGRELTKLHEERAFGTLLSMAERDDWRGEITLVLAPIEVSEERLSEEELDRRIEALRGSGTRARAIAKQLAQHSGWSSRDIYARMHRD